MIDKYDAMIVRLRSKLKSVRVGHGWSFRQLEQRSGVKYRTIVRIENGETDDIGISHLMRLANALSVPLNVLLSLDTGGTITTTESEGKEMIGRVISDVIELAEIVDIGEVMHLWARLAREDKHLAAAPAYLIRTLAAEMVLQQNHNQVIASERQHNRELLIEGAYMVGVVPDLVGGGALIGGHDDH